MSFAKDVPYFVQSDSDPTVLLAIDPAVSGDHVGWFDTVRDRLFRVVSSHESQGVLTFVTASATYELRPLTLELYERYVHAKVDGTPRFFSTEQVRSYYQAFPR